MLLAAYAGTARLLSCTTAAACPSACHCWLMLVLVPGCAPRAAGHLKKRLPSRGSELAASKRLRALAGLALKRDADSEDEEEAELEAELDMDDELASADVAPRANGSARRGVRTRYAASDGGSDGEDEGEDEELVLRSLHRSKLARTGSGAASPRTASLAPPVHAQPGSGGRRAGGSASAGRRHVTRAATGSLRPRHFDELDGPYGSDEEQYDAVLDAEERYLLQVGPRRCRV